METMTRSYKSTRIACCVVLQEEEQLESSLDWKREMRDVSPCSKELVCETGGLELRSFVSMNKYFLCWSGRLSGSLQKRLVPLVRMRFGVSEPPFRLTS
jgi:hypothetical protein